MSKLPSLMARASGLGYTFSLRALKPPPRMMAFSRVSHQIRRLESEKEETFGHMFLKYGLTLSFIYGVFTWVDYGGYRATTAKWDKLNAEIMKERLAYIEAVKKLNASRPSRYAEREKLEAEKKTTTR